MSKVIVVGAGPAGIMAALSASKNNEVILIERNNEIGKKLKLTGGGRCNITNNRDIEEFFDKIVTNKKFLYSALYNFTNRDLLDYFSSKGLEYKVEYDEKVFTKSDKADEVIDIFKRELMKNDVRIYYNTKVQDLIIKNETINGIVTEKGDEILADKVIVTTGGKSYPTTGSDGSMFDILQKHGHSINNFYPALIPLVTKNKKKKIQRQGDMIFTHFGISGPGVLKFSSYINKLLKDGEVNIKIDFLPYISKEELSKIIRGSNKSILNNLKEYLPQNFIKEILNILNLTEVKVAELKKEDEVKLIEHIKEMTLTVEDTITIKAAMVTSGGVSVKEINSSTMESKKIKNLFFAGEVIDIDAETGGFNLQIAFSTGYLAGMLGN